MIYTVIQAIACLFIIYRASMRLNAMTCDSCHCTRWAHVTLVAGAVTVLTTHGNLFQCVFAVCVALYMAAGQGYGHAHSDR